MTIDSDMACLKSIKMFSELEPSRLKLVALMGERLRYREGENIVRQGHTPEAVYYILSGEVEITRGEADDGHEHPAFTLKTGSIAGDVPLLSGRDFLGDARAATDVTLLRLPKDLFFELMQTVPGFAVAVARDLATRLYKVASRVLDSEMA